MLFFCIVSKVYSRLRGWHHIDLKEATSRSLVEEIMKLTDLGERTSFIDQVYLGSTQRECKQNEFVVDDCRKMVESWISAGAIGANVSSRSYDIEGYVKKCFGYSRHILCWRSSVPYERRIWNVGRIVQSLLLNRLELLVLGTYW